MRDPKPFENIAEYGKAHMGWPDVEAAPAADHRRDALAWLDAAAEPTLTPAQRDVFSGVASVHATLALVEQQRIANLIAFRQWFPNSPKTLDAIRAEIERGLGLL
jgi:hypothetical protein